jgi:serine/threonine-protein kinase
VHRDIKPENIFVANVHGERVVKILDYGIAKAKSVASQIAGRASQTGTAFASFTPAYGAPEQWLPKRYGQTGPWTDVWGLGLVLVEGLAGRPVIDGDQAAMMGTALDANRRPSPRAEGVEVSDAVEAVFQRALALDPRHRHSDAGEFWAQLDAARVAPARPPKAAAAQEPAAPGLLNLGETLVDPSEVLADAPRLDLDLESEPPVVSQRSGRESAAAVQEPIDGAAAPGADLPVPGSSVLAMEAAAARTSSATPLARPTPAARAREPHVAPPASLVRDLTPALVLVCCSVIATVVDQAYAANTGELLSIGPVRASWIAALLLLVGLGHGAARIAARRSLE